FLRDSTEGGAIIGLAFGKHRPDRACQLVGYRCRGRQQPHAGYLAKHLSRAFEKPTTCNKFSSHERIGISQHFLYQTTHSVAYIAEKVGISRASDFATAFRKHCNMSPISYRKTIVQQRG